MSSPSSCKCLHCREFFIPCPNSRHTQRYCAKAECRKASKAAAQAKWLNKPENRSYFRGPENTERVQRWRERHPGHWRKKRSSSDALQDLAPTEVSPNQPITFNETGHLAEDFTPREPLRTLSGGAVTRSRLCSSVTIDGSRKFGGYLAIVYTFVGGTWKIRRRCLNIPPRETLARRTEAIVLDGQGPNVKRQFIAQVTEP
jgi:hypothetical protein